MRHKIQTFAYSGMAQVPSGPPLLLCHDIVEDGHESEEQASWRTCIHHARLLLSRARACNWIVVHAFASDLPPEPIEAVRPLPAEPIFQCKGPSAFSSSALRDLVAATAPSQILLIGRSLLPMCLASAAASADLRLPLSIVSDAVSISKAVQDDETDQGFSIVTRLLPLFARLTTTAQVLKIGSFFDLVPEHELA